MEVRVGCLLGQKGVLGCRSNMYKGLEVGRSQAYSRNRKKADAGQSGRKWGYVAEDFISLGGDRGIWMQGFNEHRWPCRSSGFVGRLFHLSWRKLTPKVGPPLEILFLQCSPEASYSLLSCPTLTDRVQHELPGPRRLYHPQPNAERVNLNTREGGEANENSFS